MPSISGWSQTAVETSPILFVTPRTSRARADELGAREAAHRQVVVARPAEAAHARAAARDLDHVLHRHLGVRREDHRLREAHGARPAALAHDAGPGRRRRRRCRPRGSGPRSARDVEAVLRLERLETLARVGAAEQRLHHPRHERLALADGDEVGERARAAPGSGTSRRRPGRRAGRAGRGPSRGAGCPRAAAPAARAGSRSRRRSRRRRRRSRAAASRSRS